MKNLIEINYRLGNKKAEKETSIKTLYKEKSEKGYEKKRL